MLTVQQFNSNFTKAIQRYYDLQSKTAIQNSVMNRIFQVDDSTEYTSSYISTEGIDLPKYLSESENAPISDIGKGYKTTFESAEFGHAIIITAKERIKNKDNTEKLLQITQAKKNGLLYAMHTFLEQQTHRLFTEAFASSTFLAPDGFPMISATHTWNSTGKTFSNLLPGAGLDLAMFDYVGKVAGSFEDSKGSRMPLKFNTVVVQSGSTAFKQARRLFGYESDAQYRPTSIGGINIYQGAVNIIETPWMTGPYTDTQFFFLADLSLLNIDNPLFVDFLQRPSLGDAFEQNINNGDWKNMAMGSFKFGIRNMPFTILGSRGQ